MSSPPWSSFLAPVEFSTKKLLQPSYYSIPFKLSRSRRQKKNRKKKKKRRTRKEQEHFGNMFKRLIPTLNRSLVEKIVPPRSPPPVSLSCRKLSSPPFTNHILNHQSSSLVEEPLYPFSLVADELSKITNHIRSKVVSRSLKLTSAAQYFFKVGVHGKQVRPTVLLLMAKSLNMRVPEPTPNGLSDGLTSEQLLAAVTEMIHVASLIHDDVLDIADTRRGVASLNIVMGNKRAVSTGTFLLGRATKELASLKNTEVFSLLTTVLENLVDGERKQMYCTPEQRYSMEYYMEKTYDKTASLMANSYKAIPLLAGQSTDVQKLAFKYGKNLGMAYQLIDDVLDYKGTSASLGKGSLSDIRNGILTAPMMFAIEEFPQLRTIFDQGIDKQKNIEIALDYLDKSCGIQRTRELVKRRANLAASAINDLPETNDEDVNKHRQALKSLAHQLVTRDR